MRAFAALLALWPLAALAQSPADEAVQAAESLRAAQTALAAAEALGPGERAEAIAGVVRAYEDGLAALRDAVRRTEVERRALAAELDGERARLGRLLGALQARGAAPAETLLLHPGGALAAAQAGMLAEGLLSSLAAEAEALGARVARLDAVQAERDAAVATLTEGLAHAQDARAALAAASADRSAQPRAYAEDPVATALLLASTDSLDAFAAGLDQTMGEALGDAPDVVPDGSLPLPVEGTILRHPGEPDARGVERPGVVLATDPRALVTVPVDATLRFRGPLLDLGQVAILEPAPDVLIVLAGLAQVFGNAGEVLAAGAPLGLMGGEAPQVQAILSASGDGEDAGPTETLYLEVRDGSGPVDPALWFALPSPP